MHFDPWEIKHPWSFLVASLFVFCMFWVFRLCLCVCVLVHVSVANAICSPGVAITQSDPEHHKIIHCSISKRLYTVLLCLCVSIYMCVCVCVCSPMFVFLCFKWFGSCMLCGRLQNPPNVVIASCVFVYWFPMGLVRVIGLCVYVWGSYVHVMWQHMRPSTCGNHISWASPLLTGNFTLPILPSPSFSSI